jgi:hypothetical protein
MPRTSRDAPGLLRRLTDERPRVRGASRTPPSELPALRVGGRPERRDGRTARVPPDRAKWSVSVSSDGARRPVGGRRPPGRRAASYGLEAIR